MIPEPVTERQEASSLQRAGSPTPFKLEAGDTEGMERAEGAGGVLQFHNTFPESSAAMASILPMHFPTGTILDVNFGHGVFYQKVARDVTGVDVRPPAKIICDNAALPFADDSFDVGVCDPPYKRGNTNKRYESRYGVAPDTEPKVTRLYYAAMTELLRVCRQGMIVKCQDAADGHSFHARHVMLCEWVKEKTGLRVHDIATVIRWGVPNANTQGTRHFFQQSTSYFLIWKWRSKCPFKPVRF